MTDLFAQEGITFEQSSMASTAPSTNPDPITAPKVDLNNDTTATAAPSVTGPVLSDAPHGNKNMTPDDQRSALSDLFGTDNNDPAPAAAAAAAAPASGATPGGRDLFADQGIISPGLDAVNSNAVNAGINLSNPTPEQKQAADFANSDVKQWQMLAPQLGLTQQQIQNWKTQPIGPIEAASMLNFSDIHWSGGFTKMAEAYGIKGIADKIQNGTELTPAENTQFTDFMRLQAELKIRGFSNGGATVYYGAQIPAFMAQFLATDGAGKAVQESILAGAEKSALTSASAAGARLLTTTSLMAPEYAGKYGERRLNDGMTITDKGDVVSQASQESPYMSALLAYTHTAVDVASMEMGPGISKYVIDPVTKAVSTPLVAAVNQLPAAVRSALYDAYKVIDPTAQTSKAFTAIGWKSMLEGLGVGQVDNAMNGALSLGTEKNYTTEDLLKQLNPGQQSFYVNAGIIGVAGALHSAFPMVVSLMESKGVPRATAEETASNMTALEREGYVNTNLPTPKSAYPDPITDAAQAKEPITPDGTPISQSAEAAVARGQMDAQEEKDPPPVQDKQSGFNAGYRQFIDEKAKPLYAQLLNDIQASEDLAGKAQAGGATVLDGESSKLLTNFARVTPEWIRRNHMFETTVFDAEGNQQITGKGLKPIYDDFDNMFLAQEPDMATRHQDFENFLQAERINEEAGSGRDVLITDEQKTKAMTDLADLAGKYGDNFKFFDTYANEVREWDSRILHNLVDSGLKTQEWFDQVTSARKKYSPLQRVVEDDQNQSITRRGLGNDPNANRIGSLKQFKGSELEIRNTFDSRLKNSALILQKSAVNRLRLNIAKYAQYYPDEVKVSNPRIVRGPVKVSYDPKLREKLEKAAEFMSAAIKRETTVKVKGFRGVLGSYSPAENMVRVKIGTTEGTLAHEIGHMLDFRLGLKEKMLSNPKVKAELQALAEDRLSSTHELEDTDEGMKFKENKDQTTKKYLEYIKNDREILANFYDAYVNSPEQVDQIAPKARAAFEKIIDADPQLSFLKDIKPSTARAEETIVREQRDMQGPPDSVAFYDKGKRKYLELSPALVKAFGNMSPTEMGMVEKFIGAIFRGSKHTLQFGATHYPEFMLRHFFRAGFTSFINTPGGIRPSEMLGHVKGILRGIHSVITQNESYRDWASSSGAFRTYMDLTPEGLAKVQKQMFSKGSIADFINPLKGLNAMLKIADQAPRVAVFEKMKSLGASDLAAGMASLEATGNYGRHGSTIKHWNQYAPFLNDMMQTGDRFIRSIAKNPAGFTTRALATITLPQLMLTGYYLYAADDKTRKEYLEFPDWSRSTFMHIKIGDQWIPLPRPFAPGYVFGAMPEQMMIHAYGGYHPETKNFWLHMMSGAATSVSPVFDWTRAMTPIIKSAIEGQTNYSFFRGMPLFTGDMEKTAPSQQYNQYTSETGKLIGKAFNISPIVVDNTVYDMAAQVGKWGLQLSDAAINQTRKMEGQPVPQKATRPTDNPIYGKLLANTPNGTQSESYLEFREHLQDAAQSHNMQKNLTGEESAQYQQANAQVLSQYRSMNTYQKQIQNIEKQIKLINKDTNMSSDDKTKQENDLNDQITRVAESANKQYRQATAK